MLSESLASDRCQSLSPYIAVRDAAAAIDFYVAAFGAEELFRLVDPIDGRIGHAELRFGQTTLMISDEYPDFGALSPDSIGGSPVKFQISVPNVDSMFARAISLGAAEVRPVKDQFFGERTGTLTDPFGHSWSLATRTEDVSAAEMQRRWAEGVTG
jgi:PhnB protein